MRVLDPEVKGKAAKGYLWFFGVPGGDVMLVFDPRRSYKVLEEQLGGFAGAFQSDAYEVYEVLRKSRPGIKRLGCAAHARRNYYEAALEGNQQAIWFIGRFRELYRIEDEVREVGPEERQAVRQARAPQIWAEMKSRAEELKAAFLPKSSLGKAVNCSILQSCRRRGIETQEYLTDVLTRLPGMKNTEIDQLRPENWKAARTQTT